MPGSQRYSVSKQEEIWNRQQVRNRPCSVFGGRHNNHGNKTDSHSIAHILFVCMPVFDVFISVATILSCFFWSRTPSQQGVPFPNEVALDAPQSCLFAMGISLSSFLSLVVYTLKYKQIASIFDGFVNQLSFACGILASISQFTLGNFPMKNEFTWINIGGVAGYLSLSIIYCSLHIYLTRNTPAISNKPVYITRILLLEFTLVSSAVLCAFLVPDLSHWNQGPNNVAQIASWCCLSFLFAYKLTFVNDLKQMYFHFDILITPSQAEAVYHGHKRRLLLMEDDETGSARLSTRSKKSRSSVRSNGTMSEVNTIFNYPVVGKSTV